MSKVKGMFVLWVVLITHAAGAGPILSRRWIGSKSVTRERSERLKQTTKHVNFGGRRRQPLGGFPGTDASSVEPPRRRDLDRSTRSLDNPRE